MKPSFFLRGLCAAALLLSLAACGGGSGNSGGLGSLPPGNGANGQTPPPDEPVASGPETPTPPLKCAP